MGSAGQHVPAEDVEGVDGGVVGGCGGVVGGGEAPDHGVAGFPVDAGARLAEGALVGEVEFGGAGGAGSVVGGAADLDTVDGVDLEGDLDEGGGGLGGQSAAVIGLFGVESFTPHGHCYLWTPALLWMQVLSNVVIGVSYLVIAAVICHLNRQSRFFSNLSHQLRMPLALVRGRAEQVKESLDEEADEREHVDGILYSSGLLLKHIDDLLEISRLDARDLEMRPSRFDLAGLVRQSAGHFKRLAGRYRIDFEVDLPEALVVRAGEQRGGPPPAGSRGYGAGDSERGAGPASFGPSSRGARGRRGRHRGSGWGCRWWTTWCRCWEDISTWSRRSGRGRCAGAIWRPTWGRTAGKTAKKSGSD